jgi:phosphate transport system substrate-binding protein
MKRLARVLTAAAFIATSTTAFAADISGAGATFPYPVYAKWAAAYKKEKGVALNYQSIGSGGGIKQIKAGTVTFGASDMPLQVEDLDAAGLVQWPMIMGGAVPAINVPGIGPGQIVLDGPTLAAIYMGKVAQWDDPAIKALNPEVKLPDTAIAPVYRSDGSGTNFLFTTYLSGVSDEFARSIGANTSVQWPAGIGAKGNEGVANMVKLTEGAIGYVEYAYVKQNSMTYARLENKEGVAVAPDAKAFQAAAANADWAKAPGLRVILTNEPGKDSWPITGASFILMPKQPKDPQAALKALAFFDWAYRNGGEMADGLDYVAMPESVVKLVQALWHEELRGEAGKPLWPAS